jgi:hypothetical protein
LIGSLIAGIKIVKQIVTAAGKFRSINMYRIMALPGFAIG